MIFTPAGIPSEPITQRSPVQCRHGELSLILSADDDPGKPSRALMELAVDAIRAAWDIDLQDISRRMEAPPYYPDIWPGEHYKLLAALVQTQKPRTVIELGTATGTSALAMKKYLPADGRIVTFDPMGWRDYPGGVLTEADFADGRLVQYGDDLSDPAAVRKHAALLEAADLIFMDAMKDGRMEQDFLDNFQTLRFRKPPLLVFDDIRLWNMLGIWRDIRMPKLDLTSFGHWSGTGLVAWT